MIIPPVLLAAAQACPPQTALVLGSGLSAIANRIDAARALPFPDCPPLLATHVDGHAGRVILGRWCGQRVLVFAGRNHLYEGHSWEVVLAPMRLAARLGVRRFILTNAAGGIRDDLSPGTLLAITGHLNWCEARPWQTVMQTRGHDATLRALVHQAAKNVGTSLAKGTYAAVTGPNYETPAEIRALRALGADAVGMSTAREVEEGARLNIPCLAISCITNRAAGLSRQPLTHQEVLESAGRQAGRLADLLEVLLDLVTRTEMG